MALVSIRCSVPRRKRSPMALITWEGSICTLRPSIASTDRWFRAAKQREKTKKVNSNENSYLSDCCSKLERKKCHQGQHNLPWHCWKQLQILPGNHNSYSSTIYRTIISVHLFTLQNSYQMSQKGSSASWTALQALISLIRDTNQSLTAAPDPCPLKNKAKSRGTQLFCCFMKHQF